MAPPKANHPSERDLAAFVRGQLPPELQAELERHIAACPACGEALRHVPDDTLIQGLKGAAPQTLAVSAPEAATPTLAVGHTAAPVPDLPPELANHPRYRIEALLGKGGMGAVYVARHLLMERRVALKVIHETLVKQPGALERFRQEVIAAARLSHPNIVAAHDAELAGGVRFLVMDYVDGKDLALVVSEQGRLPVAQACDYIIQATRGLQHAFEQGMVHRDIKPQNLMLTAAGQVKILDFGLARLLGPRRRRLTQVGSVMGTPDYIAPEQATDASHADIRADIYSLGCTLFFLLAGRPPFAGGSSTQKLQSHVERRPPTLSRLRPEVSAALEAVVRRMMAKDAAERYATPAEVVAALTPFTSSRADAPGPVAKTRGLGRRTKMLLWTVGAAVSAAVAVLAILRPWSQVEEKKAEPKPLRIVYVVARQSNSGVAYRGVRGALETSGASFRVAAPTRLPAGVDRREGGDPISPDSLLSEVAAADFDVLILGDGIGMIEEYLHRSSAATKQGRQWDQVFARSAALSGFRAGFAASVPATRGTHCRPPGPPASLSLFARDAEWARPAVDEPSSSGVPWFLAA